MQRKRIPLFTLLLFITIIKFGTAQTTAIPDTAFEATLVAQGIDSDGLINGQISNVDAASINNLDVGGKAIHSLVGLEAFVNLDTLYCQNNNLDSIDLSQNTQLVFLRCFSNNLSSLDISANVNLQSIGLNDNAISSIDLTSNVNLIQYYGDDNNLSSIDLSQNALLVTFACRRNSLSSLDVSANTNLRSIIFSDNSISTIDVSAQPNLSYLEFNNNNLSILDVSSNTNLTTLSCNGNNLSSLVLNNYSNLRIVRCKNNQLTTLDVSNCSNLKNLEFDNNNVTHIDISASSNLELLSCENNALTGVLDLRHRLQLTTVKCQHNNLTGLLIVGSTNLVDFRCYNNNLDSLVIGAQPKLKWLYCHTNNLMELDVSMCPMLEYLGCDNNQLTVLDVSNNPLLIQLGLSNNRLTKLDCSAKHHLDILHCNENGLQHLNLKGSNPSTLFTLDNWKGLMICVDDTAIAHAQSNWNKDAKARYSETCANTTLIGYVRHDVNSNCIADSTEPTLPNHFLRFSNATDTFFTSSNTQGFYTGELDTGNYDIHILPKIPYWLPCDSVKTTSIDSLTDLDTVNWAMQIDVYCPYLTVDISIPYLSEGDTTTYLVNYCNEGTWEAPVAYIEIDIDTFINVIGTSIPVTSQTGKLYRFDLDTLDVGECGLFTIDVVVDTSAYFEQTHCTEAHIYPDTLCDNPWTGAVIEASASCQSDTVFFRLENKGGPMNITTSYTVFEDYVMLFTVPLGGLGPGAVVNVPVAAAPGKTYRIEANQEPGFPLVLGPPVAHATVVGCNRSNGGFTYDAVPQFYNNNPSPWVDNDCEANQLSPMSNSKQGQQTGYGAQHLITNAVPLDYKFKFENTGTDTIPNVIVVDTISPYLDATTIKMKSGSHPYTWKVSGQLHGQRILMVEFKDANLMPSAVNPQLSRGHFSYEIQQKPNLPVGTVINNISAIYLGSQLPIVTDTVFHTVGDTSFVPLKINTSVDYLSSSNVEISVFPNPFEEQTTIQVSGIECNALELEIVDIAGRVLKVLRVQGTNRIQLSRDGMSQGVYFYRLKSDNQLIGAGKMVVQ